MGGQRKEINPSDPARMADSTTKSRVSGKTRHKGGHSLEDRVICRSTVYLCLFAMFHHS
jgi:hypothetical protein